MMTRLCIPLMNIKTSKIMYTIHVCTPPNISEGFEEPPKISTIPIDIIKHFIEILNVCCIFTNLKLTKSCDRLDH